MTNAILMMGLPASGKSSFTTAYSRKGYQILSRDTEGGKVSSLVPRFKTALSSGQSVVLDNTFLTAKSRAPFIQAAHEAHVDIECHWMQTSFADCQVNALHRMWDRYGRIFHTAEEIQTHPVAKTDPNIFPVTALFTARKRLAGDRKNNIPCGKPLKSEGFSKIVKVPFVRRPSVGTAKALILDYDGTLRRDVKELGGNTHYPTQVEEVEALPHRQEIIQRYVEEGYLLLGVTTQSGIGKGVVTEENAVACIHETNRQVGHDIFALYCKHYNFPVACWCRKPQPGLGVQLIREFDLDPSHCIYVGDLKTDQTFANRCGFQFAWANDFFGSQT